MAIEVPALNPKGMVSLPGATTSPPRPKVDACRVCARPIRPDRFVSVAERDTCSDSCAFFARIDRSLERLSNRLRTIEGDASLARSKVYSVEDKLSGFQTSATDSGSMIGSKFDELNKRVDEVTGFAKDLQLASFSRYNAIDSRLDGLYATAKQGHQCAADTASSAVMIRADVTESRRDLMAIKMEGQDRGKLAMTFRIIGIVAYGIPALAVARTTITADELHDHLVPEVSASEEVTDGDDSGNP